MTTATTEVPTTPLYQVGETVIDKLSGNIATVAHVSHLGYDTPCEYSYRIAMGDSDLGHTFKTVHESDLRTTDTEPGPVMLDEKKLYPRAKDCYPCTDAVKHDDGKNRFDLVPYDALEEIVRVYTVGAAKYGDRNWEKGMDFGRVFAAIQRHLSAFWQGEDLDPEDDLSHLAHAAWGCLTLLHYQLGDEYLSHDDRSK